MARKKAKAKRPPLSGLDRFLYGFTEVLLFILLFFLLFLLGDILPRGVMKTLYPHRIASDNASAFFFSLPILILLGLVGIWIETKGKQARQPLFGNKNFKKPFGVPFLPAYPLFSKEFREKWPKERKKIFRKTVFLWGCFLLIAILLYSSSLFSFTVLRSNRTMEVYNCFHVKTESYSWEELQEMEISVHRQYRSSKRTIRVTFRYKNDSFQFTVGDFSHETMEESLRELVRMKDSLPAKKFKTPTKEEIEKLRKNSTYTKEDLALILELIDYTP